jgi:ABC-2 type transport system permease protein
MINTPTEIYLGILTGSAAIRAILIQAAWIAGLVFIGQLILRAGIRRLVIQGG